MKSVGALLGNERRDPDGRLEAAIANLTEDRLHLATECAAGLQPIPHRRLIAIVDLDVAEARDVTRNDVEVVEHLLRGDLGPEAVPRTPA